MWARAPSLVRQRHGVTHGDVLAEENSVLLFHAVQHAAILYVRMRAYANGVYVAAQYGIHPDAGVLAENHIADNLRRIVDVAGLGNCGGCSFVRTNHVELGKKLNITRVPLCA